MTLIISLRGSKIAKKHEKRKEKIAIKFWVHSDSNWDLLGERSVYHPLDHTGFMLKSIKIGKLIFSVENQLIFENFKRQTKAADFLDIKTRLYL